MNFSIIVLPQYKQFIYQYANIIPAKCTLSQCFLLLCINVSLRTQWSSYENTVVSRSINRHNAHPQRMCPMFCACIICAHRCIYMCMWIQPTLYEDKTSHMKSCDLWTIYISLGFSFKSKQPSEANLWVTSSGTI